MYSFNVNFAFPLSGIEGPVKPSEAGWHLKSAVSGKSSDPMESLLVLKEDIMVLYHYIILQVKEIHCNSAVHTGRKIEI